MKDKVLSVLKKDNRIWDESSQILNRNYLLKLIDNTDKDLMRALFKDEDTKKSFFTEFDNNYVFKVKDFKLFIENNKIFNSYTSYSNRIGLSDGKGYLLDSDKVVINFPFKDCILEGGQRKEESEDYYYKYNKKLTKTEKKQGYEEGKYNKRESKRNEIFYNEILAKNEIDRLLDAKAFVNWKRYTQDGESKVKKIKRDKKGAIKDNLIIKGNNLITLNSLKSQFKNKVKLIYIDVPFNTGNDSFKYNDKFNRSTWLTFMKNRLEVSKELLRSDGLIFIHCDYNEVFYLKVLCDEIFENRFINVISVKSSTPSGVKVSHADKTILKSQDFILCYKMSDNIKLKPQYQKKKAWDTHYRFFIDEDKNKLLRLVDVLIERGILQEGSNINDFDIDNYKHKKFYLENGDNIVRKSTHGNKEIKDICNSNRYKDKLYLHDNGYYYINNDMLQPISNSIHKVVDGINISYDISNVLCDFWDDIDFQNTQNQGGVDFPKGKKPEQLLYRIIDMTTNEGDIVLDFFLGSGTTCAVAHKLNRQYIGIEQMEYIKNITLERMENVIKGDQSGISNAINWEGGGDFVYCELAEWNQRAKKIILRANSYDNLKKIFLELTKKYFLDYNLNINQFINKTIEEDNFKNLSLEEQKEIFLNMLDLNHLYVSKSEMEDAKFGISNEDISLTKEFYEGGE